MNRRGPRPRALRERFEAKVDRAPGHGPWGDCHVWTGARLPRGYGRIGLGGKAEGVGLAHRVAWFLSTGRWPTKWVLHRCDNPPCVRFDHLLLGDHAANMADMVRKGRNYGLPHAHKLTADEARAIRVSTGPRRPVAERYGVSVTLVGLIRRGERWSRA